LEAWITPLSDGRRVRADTDKNLQANLVRAAKAVKREDVMRDNLTFHVLPMTPVAKTRPTSPPKFFASADNFISKFENNPSFSIPSTALIPPSRYMEEARGPGD